MNNLRKHIIAILILVTLIMPILNSGKLLVGVNYNQFTVVRNISTLHKGLDIGIQNIIEYTIAKDLKVKDKDGDKISDDLEKRIVNLTPGSKIKVSIILKQDTDINKALETIKRNGVESIRYWDALKIIHGYIEASQIRSLLSEIGDKVVLIEPGDYKAETLTDVSTRIIRAVPYVWETLGYKGDPESSIAVVDTGVDDSHPMLGTYKDKDFTDPKVKIVGWYDAVNLVPQPIDTEGHGTHVASIAAGWSYNGDADGDGDDDVIFEIKDYTITSPGVYEIPIGLYINNSGYVNVTLDTWVSSAGISINSISLVDPNGFEVASDDAEPYNVFYNETIASNRFGYWTAKIEFTSLSTGSISFKMRIEKEISQSLFYTGVAPNVKLVGVNALGDETQIVDGLDWIYNNAELYHILVLVNSWVVVDASNKPTVSLSIDLAISKIISKGIVVVVASGNYGDSLPAGEQMGSPANVDGVITVAATDEHFKITSYSSRGPAPQSNTSKPDISAPGGVLGEGMITAADTNDNELVGSEILNDTIMYLGTSMAAPHVAGAAAILAQVLGGYSGWDYDPTYLVDSKAFLVKMVLLMTAWETNNVNGWRDLEEGFGFLQVDAAVEALTREYDMASNLIGELFSENHRFDRHVFARKVNLVGGQTYDFYLYMPDDANFDLFVFAPKPNQYGEPILVAYSNSTVLGGEEHVSFTATQNGYYYIVVKQVSGEGKFVLSSNSISIVKPVLNILSPEPVYYTNKSVLKVTWEANDFYGLDRFEVYRNETNLVDNLPPSTTNYSVFLPLEGAWNITISAHNIIGESTSVSILVYLDKTAPIVNIISPKNNSVLGQGGITFKWSIDENFEVNKTILKINNNEYDVTGLTQKKINLEPGDYTVTLIVIDKAGNVAKYTIVITVTEAAEGGIVDKIINMLKDRRYQYIIGGIFVLLILLIIALRRRR